MRFALVLSLFALAGCAVEMGPADDGDTTSDEAAAKRTDPCALVRCAAGTHCEVKKGRAACVVDARECTTDADCRLFSNYCDGCSCNALSNAEATPVCKGTTVACFVDPCMNKTAVCSAGVCVVSSSTTN